MTFLITKGVNDPEFVKFSSYFEQLQKEKKKGGNVWICKPGENSNRGNGINVVNSLSEIRALVSQKCGSSRSLIIQKYM
jgi:tubulin---tyrosine ligase